jgi:biotin carboxyl carrier protein
MSRQVFILRGRGEPETIVIEGRAGSRKIHRGNETFDAQTVRLPDGRLSILLADGRQVCGRASPRSRGEVEVSSARGVCRLALADPLHDRVDHAGGAARTGDSAEEIRALMPGRVIEIAVAAGDPVAAGALLLVLEAMKMQNEIRAERAGIVGSVDVASGQAVESGTLMLTIETAGV